ncbi:hypothetical protein [Micromonospora aurantiaca]|uniref:Uncharacterized protein n=1 Tax=Micromonospora aurantiaca (nom. illeg.) TaxID=47850 RepID=A0A6N3JSS1_9ACTN|nr:hypothetical protein [Micromonospora aurantiaca]AXH88818.1 hypothetical protein DVH21_02115 [Micromonospora aurantiaca]
MFDENPANNPTRVWEVGGRDVDFDARALLRKLDSTGIGIVRHLIDHPDQTCPVQDVAEAVGRPAGEVEDAVAWINTLAEALGYRDLVERVPSGVRLPAATVAVARQGLIDAQR